MAYVLEKITKVDQEKIIKDAECDPKKRSALIYARDHHEFAASWAVDREHDGYFLLAPVTVREESWDRPYYIFVRNRLWRANSKASIGNQFYLDEEVLPPPDVLLEVQQEIRTAFAIYGRWGDGPLNEFGKPEFAVIPEFEERA